jgi:hypothetical protein
MVGAFYLNKHCISYRYIEGRYIVDIERRKESIEISGSTLDDIEKSLLELGYSREFIFYIVQYIRKESLK